MKDEHGHGYRCGHGHKQCSRDTSFLNVAYHRLGLYGDGIGKEMRGGN